MGPIDSNQVPHDLKILFCSPVFFNEVLESLQRGAKEGVNADNLTLEVNSSRHAYAVTPAQVISAVYVSIVTIAASQEGSNESATKLLTNVKKGLKQFKPLFGKYVKSLQVRTHSHFNLLNRYVAQWWSACLTIQWFRVRTRFLTF